MSGTKIKKHVLRGQIEAELLAAGIDQAPKLSTRRSPPADGGPVHAAVAHQISGSPPPSTTTTCADT